MSNTPTPFQCCAALSSSVVTPTIWTNCTPPLGVPTDPSCGSSAISMCCTRDSLLSRGQCQDTWSPTHKMDSGGDPWFCFMVISFISSSGMDVKNVINGVVMRMRFLSLVTIESNFEEWVVSLHHIYMPYNYFTFQIDRTKECSSLKGIMVILPTYGKGKVLAVCRCKCLSPVTLAFEPVVKINPLPWDTGPLWHLSFHSLPSPGFPSYPFINQPIWEDDHLDDMCVACPRPGSNLGQRICSQKH